MPMMRLALPPSQTMNEKNNFLEKIPYNFKIDAVCDIYSGTYYLSGSAVVHGELKKAYSEEMGHVITFGTPQKNSVFSHFMFDRKINKDEITFDNISQTPNNVLA